jgi:hypothetical protein
MAHFPQREKATARHRRIVCGEVLAHKQNPCESTEWHR